jgi:hypothetical protein
MESRKHAATDVVPDRRSLGATTMGLRMFICGLQIKYSM